MASHHPVRSPVARGGKYPQSPVHDRAPEPGVGRGYQLRVDSGGLALSGGGARSLLVRRDRLGDGDPAHRGSRAAGTHDGDPAPHPKAGLLHHSDRGSQYAATSYQQLLTQHGIAVSMSRRGNCWDEACVESFFGTLKRELIYHRRYRTREEATQDIFEYIEVFYNRLRRHSTLGYYSPAEFEARTAVA